jgi:hypothetical protein
MAFWKKSPAPSDPAMKLIVYRGGVVTFRIPSHWCEEYSDIDGGTFYEDRRDSGTLRLKILTVRAPKELRSGAAKDVLEVVVRGLKAKSVEGSTKERKDGNAVLTYEEATVEQGTHLTISYWVIANPIPPYNARIATFSYTILAKQRRQRSVLRDLKMLEEEIESATFSPELGVVSDRQLGSNSVF